MNEDQIILTFDRDYGELIYQLGMRSPVGIVYFRCQPLTPEEPAENLLSLLNIEGLSLKERFTVVERYASGTLRDRILLAHEEMF